MARIDAVDRPGWARHERQETGRADDRRLGLQDGRVALQRRPYRPADLGMGAVASDDVAGGDGFLRVPADVGRCHEDLIVALLDRLHAHSVLDAQAWGRRSCGEQDRLEKDLINAMRRLWRRPPRVRTVLCRIALRAARNLDASELEVRQQRCEWLRRGDSPPAVRRRARRCAMPRRRKASIDRALTTLVRPIGGAPAARISAIITETPRWARSIAIIMPTGPAPTMSTSASFRSDIGISKAGLFDGNVDRDARLEHAEAPGALCPISEGLDRKAHLLRRRRYPCAVQAIICRDCGSLFRAVTRSGGASMPMSPVAPLPGLDNSAPIADADLLPRHPSFHSRSPAGSRPHRLGAGVRPPGRAAAQSQPGV